MIADSVLINVLNVFAADGVNMTVHACSGSYDEFAVKRIEVNSADLSCKQFYHIR